MANSVRFTASVDDKVSSTLSKIRDRFDQLGKGAASATFVGVVGAKALAVGFGLVDNAMHSVVGVMGDAIKASNAQQESISSLNASLKANVPAWDGRTTAIEATIKAQEALGFTDTEQRTSLELLVAATHDVTKAQQLQSAAMDLARFKHISLQDATEALTRVEAGNYRILKNLGIELPKGATQMQALAAVEKVAAGQAADFAATNEGQLLVSQVKVNDAMEKFGTRIAPLQVKAVVAITDAIGGLSDAVDNFSGQHAGIDQAVSDQLTKGTLAQLIITRDAIKTGLGKLGAFGWGDPQLQADLVRVQAAIDTYGKKVTDDIASVGAASGKATDDVVAFGNTTDTITGKMADDFEKHVVPSYYDIASAARTTASRIATESGKLMHLADLVTKRYVDDATATIRGYFDPLEERWALHETRVQIATDAIALKTAKGKEAQGAAAAAIVKDLDTEAAALVVLGGQHKLTAKDVANFAKDAKANYKSLGKDGRHEVDTILGKLRTLAGLPDITMKFTLLASVAASGKGVGVGGHVSGHGILIYDKGGVVPGPKGAPQLAVVHGGEVVIPNSQTGGIQLAPMAGGMGGSGTGGGLTVNFNSIWPPTQEQARSIADVVEKRLANRFSLGGSSIGLGGR